MKASEILLLSVETDGQYIKGVGELLVITCRHLVEMPLDSAGVLARLLRTIMGLRYLDHLWAQVSGSVS